MNACCDCLTYNINSNEFSPEESYLNNCLENIFSLNFDYYKEMNHYFLYCFQSTTNVDFININENFNLYNEEILYFDLYNINCTKYYFYTILKNKYNISIFLNCDNALSVYNLGELKELIPPSTTSTIQPPILALPSITYNTIISSNHIDLYSDIIINSYIDTSTVIIQKKINKTKEEIIDDMNEILN